MSPARPSRLKKKAPSRALVHSAAPEPSAFEKAMNEFSNSAGAFPNVSIRWLLGTAALVLLAACACAWFALCVLYWQGSWQLLYHPNAAITRTPASEGLTFESVHFAATETGTTQLTGWWLPDQESKFTVLYLHGADGNLSDILDTLTALHQENLTVFAIDYRGYGQSLSIHDAGHPNEKQLRQDAEWALTWITQTRRIPARSIIVYGSGLGANLAAQVAAEHSELAGVILDNPLQDPLAPVFNDSRSRLVPSHLFAKDRYDLNAPSAALRISSLWLLDQPQANQPETPPKSFKSVQFQRTIAWLNPPIIRDPHFAKTLHRWLDDL